MPRRRSIDALIRTGRGPLLVIALASAAGCATNGEAELSERVDAGREAYLQEDFETAFERLIVAAEQGHPQAQYTVGYMYYEGQGVARDEERAVAWRRRAAEGGHADAVAALGELAGMGSGRGTGRPAAEEAPLPLDPGGAEDD